eukprot:3278968-Rhodomonas_salina.1
MSRTLGAASVQRTEQHSGGCQPECASTLWLGKTQPVRLGGTTSSLGSRHRAPVSRFGPKSGEGVTWRSQRVTAGVGGGGDVEESERDGWITRLSTPSSRVPFWTRVGGGGDVEESE